MKTPQTAGLTKYVHHAQRFGTEAVLETAIEQGVSYEQLIKLQLALDEIDKKARLRARFDRRKGPRLSAEIRVRRALGLPDKPEEEGQDA